MTVILSYMHVSVLCILLSKRVSDFEPIRLPNKRVPVEPTQTLPMEINDRPATRRFSAARTAGGAFGSPTPLKETPPPDTRATDSPQPDTATAFRVTNTATPARRERTDKGLGAGGGRATTGYRDIGRAPRGPGGAATRVDPIPFDASEDETTQRIVADVVSKINKYSIPLGAAVRVNPVQIYSKVGGKLMGVARMVGTRPRDEPASRDANLYESHRCKDDVLRPLSDFDVGWPLPVSVPTFHDAEPASKAPTHTTRGARVPGLARVTSGYSPPSAPTYQQTNTLPCYNLDTRPQKFSVCRGYVRLTNARGEKEVIRAVIDTGASYSVVPVYILRRLDLMPYLAESRAMFLNADGLKKKATGQVRGMQVSLGGDLTYTMDMYVSQAQNYELLLGMDFLYPLKASIDFEGQVLEFTNDSNQRSTIPITCVVEEAAAPRTTSLREECPDGVPEIYMLDGDSPATKALVAPDETAGVISPARRHSRIISFRARKRTVPADHMRMRQVFRCAKPIVSLAPCGPCFHSKIENSTGNGSYPYLPHRQRSRQVTWLCPQHPSPKGWCGPDKGPVWTASPPVTLT